MQKIIAAVVLGGLLTLTGRAENATPPAKLVDSDVVKDWNGSFALGFNISKGNSDTLLLTASARAEKFWKQDEWQFGADGAYGINNFGGRDEEKTANNLRGFTNYRHLFSDRLYGGASLEAIHDDIADVSYRVILSPSAGYYFMKSPATRLRGEVGPAFIAERIGGDDKRRMAVRFSERFERDLNKNAKIWQQVDYLPQADDFGHYLLNAEVGVEAALNSRLSLRVVGQDRFNSRPPPGRHRNDLAVVTALVYKFAK